VHLVGSRLLVRVVSLVCAALGVGPLLLGCRPPKGAGVPALSAVLPPVSVGGRETRASFELSNGLRVILEENHVTPVVALQVWVGAGAADEATQEAGLAHLVERVVVGGPREGALGEAQSASSDAQSVSPVVASWTGPDATVFQVVVAAPFVDAGVDALAAPFARATFAPAALERARADALGELRRAVSDPTTAARRALYAEAFAGHGYGRGVLGTEATLQALTGARVDAFRRQFYGAANATLVVVGDLDARAVRARLTAAFGAWPRGAAVAARAAAPSPAGPRATAVAVEAGGARVAVGFRIPPLADADLAAIDVLGAALAETLDDGRLTRALVRERQLAISTRADVFAGRDGGLLVLEAPLVASRADEAARVVLDEALRLAREELSPAELEAARAALEADLARGVATTSGYARRLGFFATVARAPDAEERYRERLRALTPADVRAVASRVLRDSTVTVAASLPDATAAGVTGAASARLREIARASEAHADARGPTAPPTSADVTSFANVVRVALPSGPRVLVLRDPTVSTVSVRALWSGGLRLEDARSNGITSLLAALLTRGTRTRDAAHLAAAATALGGSLAGVAGRDELGLRAEFLSRHLAEGLALVADCLVHPAFPEPEVERARLAALERVRVGDDDAAAVAARLFAGTLWPRHPYRLPLTGTGESLSRLTRRRLVEHYRLHYGAANLTIAVVGDVDVARVVALLRTLFADAPAALGGASATAPDAPVDAAEVFELIPNDDVHVVLGYPAPALRDADRRAAEVLARILGGPDGRLAREGVGPALVDAALWSGLDAGAFTLDVSTAPAGLDAVVPALRQALERVVGAGVSAPEVARAAHALVAADARSLERRDAVAAALARDEVLGLGAGAYRRAPAELAAVTPEAVTRVARRILVPAREIVAAVRPLPKVATKPATGGGRVSAP
jgi:zinc protease